MKGQTVVFLSLTLVLVQICVDQSVKAQEQKEQTIAPDTSTDVNDETNACKDNQQNATQNATQNSTQNESPTTKPQGVYNIQIRPAWFFSVQFLPMDVEMENQSSPTNDPGQNVQQSGDNMCPLINNYGQNSPYYLPSGYPTYNQQPYNYNLSNFPFTWPLQENTQTNGIIQYPSQQSNSYPIVHKRTKRSVNGFNTLFDEIRHQHLPNEPLQNRKICKKSIITPKLIKAKLCFKKYMKMIKKKLKNTIKGHFNYFINALHPHQFYSGSLYI